jgi:hypothetical protein
VVDGEATSLDWSALDQIAASDAAVWERLGRAHRAHARLEREVEDAIAIAELIGAPTSNPSASAGRFSFARATRQYGGWAAAAAIALAWVGLQRSPAPAPQTGAPGPRQAGPVLASEPGANTAPLGIVGDRFAGFTPEEALDHYVRSGLASGNVLGEMQPMLLDARDLGEGKGKEVWYVRPILERTTVSDLSVLNPETDELGVTRFVPQRITTPLTTPGASPQAAPRTTTSQPAKAEPQDIL